MIYLHTIIQHCKYMASIVNMTNFYVSYVHWLKKSDALDGFET